MLLRALLHPFPAERFLAEHWGRRPLLVRGGPERLACLSIALPTEPAEIPGSLAYLGSALAVHAALPHERWLRAEVAPRPYVRVGLEDAEAAVAGGASVQINGLERASDLRWGPAADLARGLVAEIGLYGEVGVAVTWSAPGARFAPHLDPAGAILVQLHGRKRYRYGREPWVDPQSKGHYFADGGLRFTSDLRDEGEALDPGGPPPPMEEVELEPGDLLYLPPGTLHETEALTESVALLLMWMERDALSLVHEVLRAAFGDSPAWRRLPPGPALDGPALGGSLPAPVADHLADRLEELAALLRARPAASPVWALAWNAAIARAAGAPTAAELAPGAPVRLRPDARVRCTAAAGGWQVHVGEAELALEPPWSDLLAALAAGPATADALAARLGLDPADVLDALATLAEHGVVASSPRDPG